MDQSDYIVKQVYRWFISFIWWSLILRISSPNYTYLCSIFEVKLTFHMLTVCGNSIHFRLTNGCSCESAKVFETENISTWGGLEPPTFGFMPNALSYWAIKARHLLSGVLNTGSCGIDLTYHGSFYLWNAFHNLFLPNSGSHLEPFY